MENSNNIFLITYKKAILLEFSSFISVKYVYNMFLAKVQQSCCKLCYTKLCNYIEEFVLKLISNIPNILVCCNKFHYVLKCFLLSNAWVNFSRLNTIKKWKIVSSFSSLILHAVNFLLWKTNHLQGFPHGEIRISH